MEISKKAAAALTLGEILTGGCGFFFAAPAETKGDYLNKPRIIKPKAKVAAKDYQFRNTGMPKV